MINPFFKNIGPININEILRNVGVNNNIKKLVTSISDVKDLVNAKNKDITFFHSKKYESVASTTKASHCITTKQLSNILPKNCEAIEVNNVLVSTSIITQMFYPNSVTDAGVGALCARTAVIGAFLNVKINCGDCDDKVFVDNILEKGQKLIDDACLLENEIMEIIYSKI